MNGLSLRTLQAVVDDYVLRVLTATRGNKSEAARVLGVHRSRVRRLARGALDRAAAAEARSADDVG